MKVSDSLDIQPKPIAPRVIFIRNPAIIHVIAFNK